MRDYVEYRFKLKTVGKCDFYRRQVIDVSQDPTMAMRFLRLSVLNPTYNVLTDIALGYLHFLGSSLTKKS